MPVSFFFMCSDAHLRNTPSPQSGFESSIAASGPVETIAMHAMLMSAGLSGKVVPGVFTVLGGAAPGNGGCHACRAEQSAPDWATHQWWAACSSLSAHIRRQ